MEIIIPEEVENKGLVTTGFFKLWTQDSESGRSTLQVDKKNTIMYNGASILARALGGIPNTKVSHMYLGFTNTTAPSTWVIDKANPNFPAVATTTDYLRIPLTFPASYTYIGSNYSDAKPNVVVFTVLVNDLNTYKVGALTLGVDSKFFEAALVSSLSNVIETDVVLARVSFNTTRVTYDSTQSLNISWGVKFTCEALGT